MSSSSQKFDSELLLLLEEYKASSAPRASEIDAFITTQKNLDCLHRLGIQPQISMGNSAFVAVSPEELDQIAELPDVIRIEAPKRQRFTQDNIRDAFSTGRKLRHEDTNGHGTHVAGLVVVK